MPRPSNTSDSSRRPHSKPARGRDGAPRSEQSVRTKGTPPPAPAAPREQFLPGAIRIVYEDASLIVVDKPTGILTASIPGDNLDSVFRAIKVYARHKTKRRGTQVWIIHRLDKEASGLLVFAKTVEAFEWLKDQFRAKHVHRLYAAVVEGEVKGTDPVVKGKESAYPSGTIQSFLVEDDEGIVRSARGGSASLRAKLNEGKSRTGDDKSGEPKLAITHYRVMATGHDRSLLQVRLETGRKNQIRVHMKELGHPIIGDRRYGSEVDPIERVCLHAFELAFAHPENGETLRFHSPTPPAFWKLIGKTAPHGDSGTDAAGIAASLSGANATGSSPSLASPASSQESSAHARNTRKPELLPSPSPASSLGFGDGDTGLKSSWDHVADWYSHLIEDRGSDHHQRVIIPGTVRLMNAKPGETVLDVACGQGNLCRALGSLGIACTGVDASPKLVENAGRIRVLGGEQPRYLVGDARMLGKLNIGPFDHATCIMALMNIEPLAPVFAGLASSLKIGGHLVGVILHPAFRAPGQTSWGWDDGASASGEHAKTSARSAKRDGPPKLRPGQRLTQFRRVDGYLSPAQRSILMNPGAASSGKGAVTTFTYHRPIQQYIKLLAEAGFAVDGLEEWPSLRVSEPGPKASEENRARREIPMFLAFRALRVK